MRQAIVTKWLPPTNYRAARVKAIADAGQLTLNWDHALDIEGNHREAAVRLCSQLGWPMEIVGGSLPGWQGFVFVQKGD